MISKPLAHSSIRRIVFLVIAGLTLLATSQGQLVNRNSAVAQTSATTPTSLGFTFLPAKSSDSGGQLAWIVVAADVNGDGKPDLLSVNADSNGPHGTVGIRLGNGDGTFRRLVAYDAGSADTTGIGVGDLNGDGTTDLVLASGSCQCVGVLLGIGDGTFKPVTTYARGGREAASGPGLIVPVMLADINGDDKPDLIVINQTDTNYGDGTVGVLLGNGDGTFQPVVTYDTGGFGAFAGTLIDVNADGKPDLVVLNCSPSGSSDCSHDATVGVLLGNSDGTFQKAAKYDSGGLGGMTSLAVTDVNDDAKPDVIVGNNEPCSPICRSGSFGVLLGNGDGTFQGVTTYDLGAVNTAESIAVADLNEDGKMDLVLAGGGVGVWLGKGDGTFQLSNVYSNTGGTSQLLLADLDQDGKQDLIGINATSNSADVRLGNGDGTFGPIKTFSLGGKQISWGTIADLNGDGRPDLVSASWCGPYCPNEEGAVGILLNVASSPSTTTTTLTSSLNPSIYGQKVTFTAKVTSTSGPVPTGKINFILSGKNAGSPTLNTNGVATLIRSTLNSGTSSLMAMYQGDGNNLKSQTAILNQVVEPSTTKATLASSPNPSTSGQAVTFTAKITSATVVPTGSVTFQVGKTVLGTAQLSAGKAVFTTTTLPVGSTVVTVTYNSNSNFKPSLASVRQTVQ